MMNQMVSSVGPMTRPGKGMATVAASVPLFPQDAFMEGPMMAMDKDVEKPENLGLPPGWSGYVGGMMTLVRVMKPEQFRKVMELKGQAR